MLVRSSGLGLRSQPIVFHDMRHYTDDSRTSLGSQLTAFVMRGNESTSRGIPWGPVSVWQTTAGRESPTCAVTTPSGDAMRTVRVQPQSSHTVSSHIQSTSQHPGTYVPCNLAHHMRLCRTDGSARDAHGHWAAPNTSTAHAPRPALAAASGHCIRCA